MKTRWRLNLRAARVDVLEEWWFARKLSRKQVLEEQPLFEMFVIFL